MSTRALPTDRSVPPAPDVAATPRDRADPSRSSLRLLSADPSRRAAERFLLAWSVAWMAVMATVIATRAVDQWGDAGHLALGVGLALPLWLAPLVRPFAVDRARPFAERHIVRFGALIAITTLIQTYFGSLLFFERLGMEYHFHVTLTLNRTPVFLYFLTIAYFSTYYPLMSIALRAFRSRFPDARVGAWVVHAAVCYAVAFGETFFMASDRIRDLFSYRDRSFTLLYGSLCYGTLFFITLPLFARLDEAPPTAALPRPPLLALCRDALALNMLALIAYEVCANWIQYKP